MGQPWFVTRSGLAAALSVHPDTIIGWERRGWLRTVAYPCKPRVIPDPPRKTTRRKRMVELASVVELLEKMYAGEQVPPALMRRLRAQARK
jgi:hypothetical protein